MSDPFVGEIRILPFPYVPYGWLACDGTLQPINEYTPLFAVIGTVFGGDGRSTFATPDLRGRVPVGVGSIPGHPHQWQVGLVVGYEHISLTSGEVPAHAHGMAAKAAAGDSESPEDGVFANGPNTYIDASGATKVPMKAQMIAPTGNDGGAGLSHENMAPFMAMRFCICWNGTFPPQPS